ncbi:hypothetical protein [Acetobacter orleanensis]|uniref:Uncharacterized protein n=1 Tax=Acetobacter orleanensis TaxID=104099 RepID=A0A4Y3TR03_9PROT|nr:hypothetical protein [Acetobacter orleanensis]KXV62559.1 hypothetical protein AD949_10650 [Acetobacter orleanensis]PCD79994.1 hypothetical protein CO710_03820 [Acetobacter orleanensis]GAN68307.1 hypothetical protein Abol_015_146 [Acetobacter orleanensis JCM 7639]GBR27558.1 hypothetical protein AA0473_1471 [Acetobacter orleanensis NRIC 0473]GEB83879.1 hypothetical protein AOR01nite_23560 [Acetobacter orleanensis]
MQAQTPQQTAEAGPSELAAQQDADLYRHILFILVPSSSSAWVPTLDTSCDWMEHARRDAPVGVDPVSLAKTCFDESFMALTGLKPVTDGEPRDIWTKFVHRQISRKCRELNPEKFRNKPRKIVQIATHYDPDMMNYRLHALCSDGTIYALSPEPHQQWLIELPIPQGNVQQVTAQ